jgi:hypothetical protein
LSGAMKRWRERNEGESREDAPKEATPEIAQVN